MIRTFRQYWCNIACPHVKTRTIEPDNEVENVTVDGNLQVNGDCTSDGILAAYNVQPGEAYLSPSVWPHNMESSMIGYTTTYVNSVDPPNRTSCGETYYVVGDGPITVQPGVWLVNCCVVFTGVYSVAVFETVIGLSYSTHLGFDTYGETKYTTNNFQGAGIGLEDYRELTLFHTQVFTNNSKKNKRVNALWRAYWSGGGQLVQRAARSYVSFTRLT